MFTTRICIYLTIIFLGFVVGLMQFKRAQNIRTIIILLGLTFSSEITSLFIAKYYRNNSPVYHLFNPLQFILLGYFFYQNLDKIVLKRIVLYSCLAGICFSVYSSLFIQGLMVFPSLFINIETIMLIFWASLLFIRILDAPSDENIFRKPVFIITIGVLWFNLFSFIFFLLHDYIRVHNISPSSIIILHYFSNIIYYSMLLTAMLLSFMQLRNERRIKY